MTATLIPEALARGLMCYPGGGTIDGKRGDHVLLAPPFTIEHGQIAEIVEVLGAAIDAALQDLPAVGPKATGDAESGRGVGAVGHDRD